MKRREKELEKTVQVYGDIELKNELDEILNGPIQLKYYKTYNNSKRQKPYGIGVIKTYCNDVETDIEKREFNHIFSKENDANNMLDILIKHKVTPSTLKDVLEDFILV